MIFALAGNQNCGKTTLFNQLTGSNQHVGNFPGVTVDQKSGAVRGQKDCTVVDLPGIYSIRPYTPEEIVTRDFILNQRPDGIINIVDATNIQRNLYLTLQLLEMRIPMVLALNMMDEVTAGGGTIDVKAMSAALGIPVIPISAVKNHGVEELIRIAVSTARNKTLPAVYDFCSPGPVHRCIHAVVHQIEDHAEAAGLPVRFAAAKLIEDDEDVRTRLRLDQNELELIEHSVQEMEAEHGMDRNAALADMRYDFIEGVCARTVVKCQESRERRRSEAIDRVVTNKYLALPIFFGIILAIFYLTFSVVGQGLSDLLAMAIAALTAAVDGGLTAYGLNPVVHSLVIDGVFAGVGSVLSFLPIIVVLFFFLSILEDTGYMARVAFFMDQLLRKIGLSGRSIVLRARHHVHPDPGLRAGPADDDFADALHELLRQDPHLRRLLRRLLPPLCRPGDDLAVLRRHPGGRYRRQSAGGHRLPGKARTLCHGAAQLPLPLSSQCGAAVLG